MSQPPLVYVFDAHYQIFRAYYSMPDLRAPDGTPVGALRGYTSVLIKFLREHQPTHVVAAFDHAMTSFRNEIYEDYKAGRQEAPDDLEPQFELCDRVTRALGFPLYSLATFEADDVIATLVKQLRKKKARVRIVSPDKDLTALVDADVELFDLAKNEAMGIDGVRKKLGVWPEQVSDYLALMGDAVDNIPGVAGIGAKTAAALLNHFGAIDRIPEDFDDWAHLELRGAKAVHRKITEGDAALALSRALVKLRDDLPIKIGLGELRYRGADPAEAEKFFNEFGMDSFIGRVPLYAR